jgi:serine O-acetyltransferase
MFKYMRGDVSCVFDRDPAARNLFEVFTTYPGVHAILWHRINHRLWNWKLKWLARWLSTIVRWLTGIEIHPAATIGHRFFIDHGMGVVIGETAEIGDDCTLYHGVTLGGTSWQKGKRHPTLGNNVIIGAGAKVLGPITLGEGARVGSNAVVLKDVPENATVIGVPGHVVITQRTEQHKRIEEMAKKMGFDAYGMHKHTPDPVANAINAMLDHIHEMDRKMKDMCKAMKSLGAEIDAEALGDLDSCEIISSIEELDTADEQKPAKEEGNAKK